MSTDDARRVRISAGDHGEAAGDGRSGRSVIDAVERWLVPAAPAERLALWRILVGGFVAVYATVRSPVFLALADRRPGEFDGIGPWSLLAEPPADHLIVGLLLLTVATAVAVALGVGHRLVGPVFALATLGLLSLRSSYGQILWFEHLIALHALVVGFAAAGNAWRLGRWGPGSPDPEERYGHPLRLAAIVTVATYWLAGLAKLRIGGWSWLAGESLAGHIAFSATRLEVFGASGPPLADAARALGPWLAVGSVATVVIELGAPLAFLGRRWCIAWIAGIVAMHLGVALTMAVVFPYHVTAIGLVPLVDARPSRWRRWPGAARGADDQSAKV